MRSLVSKVTMWGVALPVLFGGLRAQDPPAPPVPIFGNPSSLGNLDLTGANLEMRASLTGDGLTLYYDIWLQRGYILKATRESTDQPFTGGVRLGSTVNGISAFYPAITPDGQMLYYTQQFNGDVWVATKSAPEAPDFDQARPLGAPINTASSERAGCVSPDGTEFFFVRDFNLWVARFNEPHDPFAGFYDARSLTALNTWNQVLPPCISPDGLRLFWSDRPEVWGGGLAPRAGGFGAADLWMASRPSTAEEFGAPQNLPSPPNAAGNQIAPWISSDGKTLLLGQASTVHVQIPILCLRPDPGISATFTISEEVFCGKEVVLDATPTSSGSEIVSYEWDLGDGSEAQGALVGHTYQDPGRYEVSLTVTSEEGTCNTTKEWVTVGCHPTQLDPWVSRDVGEPGFPGSVAEEIPGEDGCLLVCAGGHYLRGDTDELHFVHRPVSGDARLTAQVSTATQEDPTILVLVGLMFRESMAPDARYAALMFRFQSTVRPLLYFREETGGRSDREVGDLVEAPAVWVEMRREADTFVGSVSPDGSEWTEVSRITLSLPETLLVGVATAGNDVSPDGVYKTVRARVCQLRLESHDFIRGDCNGVDGVSGDVTDPLFLLQYIFLGGPEPPCLAACDSTGNGGIDISDAIYLLLYNFVGGPPPDGPFPECGSGPLPTDAALGCSSPQESCASP